MEMPSGNSRVESQRDSDSKPMVARNELPWETWPKPTNPNGVAAWKWFDGATPSGLKEPGTCTQGSSFLATLGWTPQSRWDCLLAHHFWICARLWFLMEFSGSIDLSTKPVLHDGQRLIQADRQNKRHLEVLPRIVDSQCVLARLRASSSPNSGEYLFLNR
jgi:hypothetical protein